MKVLQGACRKVSLPVLGVAAVGWLVFAVGFGGFNNGNNFYNDIREENGLEMDGGGPTLFFSEEAREEDFPPHRADADYFAYWCYLISFPALMVVLVLHLILHNLYIFGVIGHMLLGLCLVSGGGVFWGDGRRLFSADDNFREEFNAFGDYFPEDWRTDTYYGAWLLVEWVGVFLCLLAMIAYMTLLPFYTTSCMAQGGGDHDEGGSNQAVEMQEK